MSALLLYSEHLAFQEAVALIKHYKEKQLHHPQNQVPAVYVTSDALGQIGVFTSREEAQKLILQRPSRISSDRRSAGEERRALLLNQWSHMGRMLYCHAATGS